MFSAPPVAFVQQRLGHLAAQMPVVQGPAVGALALSSAPATVSFCQAPFARPHSPSVKIRSNQYKHHVSGICQRSRRSGRRRQSTSLSRRRSCQGASAGGWSQPEHADQPKLQFQAPPLHAQPIQGARRPALHPGLTALDDQLSRRSVYLLLTGFGMLGDQLGEDAAGRLHDRPVSIAAVADIDILRAEAVIPVSSPLCDAALDCV